MRFDDELLNALGEFNPLIYPISIQCWNIMSRINVLAERQFSQIVSLMKTVNAIHLSCLYTFIFIECSIFAWYGEHLQKSASSNRWHFYIFPMYSSADVSIGRLDFIEFEWTTVALRIFKKAHWNFLKIFQ